jgi:glycosyltransferase involved in cell wall biosynthesis
MAQERTGRPMRVCYFGTYRAQYVRNEVMLAGLRSQGVQVEECHVTLWHSVDDRVAQASGGWRHPRFWWRIWAAYWKLLRAHAKTAEYDVMMVGYPGQFDVYLGRLLSWMRRKPLVLDILMSIHLIAEERGLTRKSPFTGLLLFWLEKFGLKLPDRLIADTPEYERYYREKYNLSPARFRLVPLGVDDRLYYPRPELQPPDGRFRVLYYGTFIPLHSVETIVHAASELRDYPHIQFDLFGEGQEQPRARQLVQELKLTNVSFQGWIDKTALPEEIAQSHVCLGVFGTTKQARCTIQNKIWEGMMMQRPVITGDSKTVRDELTHRRHVYLVERANPKSLAAAILELESDPTLRQRLATNGLERALDNTIAATGSAAKAAISSPW